MEKAAESPSPLGKFVADDVFIPLQEALKQENILRYASDVECGMRYYSSVAGETYCERSITFYLNGKPSFEAW